MNPAMKRILSITLALVLAVTIPTVSTLNLKALAAETDESTDTYAPETATQELPNLDNLEQPISPPGGVGRTLPPGRSKARSVSSHSTPVNGRPDLPQPTVDDVLALKNGSRARSYRASSSLIANPTVGTTTSMINWDTDGEMQVQVAAVGSKCVVYVDTDTGYSPKASEFLPNGSTPKQTAQDIANNFDTEIYPLLTSNTRLGYQLSPYYNSAELGQMSGKINIVLYDIKQDGNSNGIYSAGFFYGMDYIEGNGDTIIYVDIGTNGGYANFINNRDIFYGTIIHEFQHLINYGQWVKNILEDTAIIEDDHDPFVSTWLNEGLSGLVDAFSAGMSASHLAAFLKQDFAPGSGYVPTDDQWYSSGDQVLAQYGAASKIIQEYWAFKGLVTPLVTYPEYGYQASKRNVVDSFFKDIPDVEHGDFDDFFRMAMFNIGVDTPRDSIDDLENANKVVWTDASASNMWEFRDIIGSGNTYAGVQNITSGVAVTPKNEFGSRSYYAQLYLADAVGATNSAITIDIPFSTAEYYIITPYNAVHVDTNDQWNNCSKMVARVNPGSNSVQVGTNNRFAILVINYNEAIDSGSFQYSTSGSGLVTGAVTTSPENGLVLGYSDMSVSLDVIAPTGLDGVAISAKVVDASSTSDAAGFSLQSGSNVIRGNKATPTFDVDHTAPVGRYKIAVWLGDSPAVYSSAFRITQKPVMKPVVSPSSLEIDLRSSSTASLSLTLGQSGDEGSDYVAKAVLSVDNGNVTVSPSQLTESGSVTVTGKKVGNSVITITFYDEYGDGISDDIAVPVTIKRTGGGSTTSTSSSSGSSDRSSILTNLLWGGTGTTTLQGNSSGPQAITLAQAQEAVTKAVAAAKAKGSSTAVVNMRGVGLVTKAILEAMAKMAGMPVIFQADSMTADGKGIDVRMAINPATATRDINFFASTYSQQALDVKAHFEKWNPGQKFAVISCQQQGDFGTKVAMAAKVSLGDMNSKTLRFYSYNKATNQYKAIAAEPYLVDTNGYLHFSTTVGDNIVVTDKAIGE